MKPLHIVTDTGEYDIDPDLDPMGYGGLLTASAERRKRLRREASDAETDALIARGGMAGGSALQGKMLTGMERARADQADRGFAAGWQQFGESLNVLGENTGKRVKVDLGSLDLPESHYQGNTMVGRSRGGGAMESLMDPPRGPTDAELERLKRRATGGSQSIASLQRGR